MLIGITVLQLISLAIAEEQTCYSSVLLHRLESLLPTSNLFCVIKENNAEKYEDVQTFQTMEQWDRFEAVNKVQIQRSQGLNQLPVRTATSQGSIAWQILGPSSIGGSNCGISHNIG